jgi:hypothetical protein
MGKPHGERNADAPAMNAKVRLEESSNMISPIITA